MIEGYLEVVRDGAQEGDKGETDMVWDWHGGHLCLSNGTQVCKNESCMDE